MRHVNPGRSKRLGSGLLAGFVATLVISALELLKDAIGVMPQMDLIGMLSGILGAPDSRAVGWFAHFLVGTALWGLLYAWLDSALPGQSRWQRGLGFGFGAWLLAMITFMPLGGAGLFGLRLGFMAPIAALVLHLIFGAVLGGAYGALVASRGTATEMAYAGQKPNQTD